MKYIRHSRVGFLLFPENNLFYHSDVAQATQVLAGGSILSAGYVRWVNGQPLCYGESISLNLKSHPGDSRALAAQLGV